MATVVLWTITAYLMFNNKVYWVTLLPAIFMTMVCSTYILIAAEGFKLANNLAYLGGASITLCITILFWMYAAKRQKIVEGLVR